MPKRSLFVVVEGIDRSGKSELVGALEKLLTAQGLATKRISYPNRRNLTGSLINSVLQRQAALGKEAMHLLFSANRWEDTKEIEAFLQHEGEKCQVVLCDRYVLSGISYSIINGLSAEFASATEQGIIAPDLTLFLDVAPDITSTRQNFGEELYETQEFQWQVYRVMKDLLVGYPHTVIPSGDRATMQQQALQAITRQLKDGPLLAPAPAQQENGAV